MINLLLLLGVSGASSSATIEEKVVGVTTGPFAKIDTPPVKCTLALALELFP